MAFLTGYTSISRRALSGVVPTIARSHPLAAGLQAAYYPGAHPSIPIVNLASPGYGDLNILQATPTPVPLVMTPEGPGINIAGTGTTTRQVNGLCPTALLQNGNLSLFVRGQWVGNTGAASIDSRIFGIYFSGAGTASPFFGYILCAADGVQPNCIGAAFASASGTLTAPTYTGTRTLTTNQMLSAGVVNPGTQTVTGTSLVYQNGVKYTATTATHFGFYGAAPQIGFGQGNSASDHSPAFVVTVAYAWNRVLGDGAMSYLNANPYALLQWPIDLIYEVLEQPSAAPPTGNVRNKAMILSPLTIAGGALEWLGRRKMKLRND
jgi:hypothetical protein